MNRVIGACALLSAAWGSAVVAEEPSALRPIEHFAALPFMSGPELSPDGQRVAAKVSMRGEQVLAILSLFEKKPPVVIGVGENDLNSWRWVNDEWLVVGIGQSARLRERIGI